MLSVDQWTTIRYLKKQNPHLGARKIARLVGVSKNTVKSALKRDSPPVYQKKETINKEIAPYVKEIEEMLNIKRFRGSRILNEIIERGYQGSKSAFYRYLKKVKIEQEQKGYLRFETEPGRQGQFDWSPYTVRMGGELTKVYVFSFLLGFSRKRVYEASLEDKRGFVFEAMEKSFWQLQGVPLEVLTDNPKCFIKDASIVRFRWNEKYLQFCGYYGFKPIRALPGKPETKGKVENPFSYLETHFIAGGEFESFEDFKRQLKEFEGKVNGRTHLTTQKTPDELFEKEKEVLVPLPSSRFIGVREELRKVSSDCMIPYGGNRYSVPWMFVGKQVWVKPSEGYSLKIFSQAGKLIEEYVIPKEKGRVFIKEEHYEGLRRKTLQNTRYLRQRFLELFPEKEEFLERLLAQKRINPSYHLKIVIDLCSYYEKEDIQKVLDYACLYNSYNCHFIRGLLERKPLKENLRRPIEEKNHQYFLFSETIKRDLKDYKLS
ncbi:MAG: IS21 family transposase [Candidatus Aminicenantales bacterium]